MSEWHETEIGKVPIDWEIKEIGSLLEKKGISVGVMYPGDYTVDGIPLIRAGDIKNGKIDKSIQYRISESTNEMHKRTILNGDELLVVLVGQPGVAVVVDEYFKGWNVARAIGVLRLVDTSERRFVAIALKHTGVRNLLLASCNTTVQPTLNLAELKEVIIPWPPKELRVSIASVLNSLDNKIDLLHRQNKTLEAIAETLFRQWFVEGAGEDCPITDLVEFNPLRKLTKGAVAPYLEMAALSTTAFNPDGWYDREFSSGMKFINGDTLLARITPCLENGKTGYVTFLAENQVGWGSTEYIVMRPVETLNPLFAYILARNQVFREYAEGCMAGSSGRQRVDIEHLKLFEICKPTKEAVLAFNEMAGSVEPKLHANMVQIKTLEKLRDALLPKLMSGEVRAS